MTNKDRCRVCNDPRVAEIERDLTAKTASIRTLAERWGVTRDSIMRHIRRHMGNVVMTEEARPRLVVLDTPPRVPA